MNRAILLGAAMAASFSAAAQEPANGTSATETSSEENSAASTAVEEMVVLGQYVPADKRMTSEVANISTTKNCRC